VIAIVLLTLPVLASDVATGVALAEVAGIVHSVCSVFSAAADETNVDGIAAVIFEVSAVACNFACVSCCLSPGGGIGGGFGGCSSFGGVGGGLGGFKSYSGVGGGLGGVGGAGMYVAIFAERENGIGAVVAFLQHGTIPGHGASTTRGIASAKSAERGQCAASWAGGGAAAVFGCFHGGSAGTAVCSDSQDGATGDLEGLNAAGGGACRPLFPVTKFAVSFARSDVAINGDFFPTVNDLRAVLTHAGSTAVGTVGGDFTLANLLSVAAAWFI